MASFKLFEPILLKQEGGYANKIGDRGGETWEGIARNFYPNWSGWSIIDSVKSHLPSNDSKGWKLFSSYLYTLPSLQILVDIFYKTIFWDKMKGDEINNQSIANFIGDWGVNAGLSVPIKHAQIILGLIQDGIMGPNTINSLNTTNGQMFFDSMRKERLNFYTAVVVAHPEDRQFLSDWISRTNSFKYSN